MILGVVDLGSDLRVTLLDETQHYFGGYYHVKVLAYCDIPVQRCCFEDDAGFCEAVSVLGESIRFERILDKMAVPASDVESVRDHLKQTFLDTTTSYLSSPGFACGFVRSEFHKRSKKLRTRVPRA